MAAQTCHAFDLDSLRNDKESVTHSFNSKQESYANRAAGATAEPAFLLLGEAFNEVEAASAPKDEPCEADVLARWTSHLRSAGMNFTLDDLMNTYRVWRSRNLIDDLFLEILEKATLLQTALDHPYPPSIRNREITQSQLYLNQSGLTLNDLKRGFASLIGFTPSHPGCSAVAWAQSPTVHLANIAAFRAGMITESEFTLAETYLANQVQNQRITLKNYLLILRQSKNRFRPAAPKPADLAPNDFSSSLANRRENLTYRKSLYVRFNSIQINLMSELIKKTFERMDATKAELIFTSPGRIETIPISPMGQYYFARKLLLKDMQDLSRSSFFEGASFTYEDLVTAALETGLINSDLLTSVFKIDDLWNPQVSRWSKIANYALQITGNSTIFLPPPYNVISSVALILIEGFMQRNHQNASQADSTYDPF